MPVIKSIESRTEAGAHRQTKNQHKLTEQNGNASLKKKSKTIFLFPYTNCLLLKFKR